MLRARLLGLILTLVLWAAPVLAAPPRIGAGAAVLVEWHSGAVLYEKNGYARRHPASLTKILTALVAVERGRLDDVVVVSRRAASVPGSRLGLKAGEHYTLEALLKALLLESANDASLAIAEHVGGSVSEFCRLMTATARELGADQSWFGNPHGLTQAGHLTTAHDLALVARAVLAHPFLNRVVGTATARIERTLPPGAVELGNTNRLLLGFAGADGVKTGTTAAAGDCLIASATRGGLRLIAVVLGASDRYADARALLEYGFANFHAAEGGRQGEVLRTLPVSGGRPQRVSLLLGSDLRGAARRGHDLRLQLEYEEQLEAPLRAGTVVGTATLWDGERVVARAPLLVDEDVERDGWWQRLRAALLRVVKAAAAYGVG